MRGCDFAWGVVPGRERELARALKACGFGFVVRYLSRDTTKVISRAEAEAYRAEGLLIVTVYEDTATWMLGGEAAGHAAAVLARDQLRMAGAPRHAPAYFADDFPITPGPQITEMNACLSAAALMLGGTETGIYGPLAAVKEAHPVRYRWQTVAWSNGVWAHDDNLRQFAVSGNTQGVQWDLDETMSPDFGQWDWGDPPKQPVPVTKPPRKHRVRKVAHAAGHAGKRAGKAAGNAVRAEPVLSSATLTALISGALAIASHHGVHIDPLTFKRILTAVVAVAGIGATIMSRPVRVGALATAMGTAATAATAFGLHVPVPWLSADMPIAALIAGLLVRGHVSPKSKGGKPVG